VQHLEATGLNKEEADMAKKIEDRLQKNKELAALISNLKGIGGDPPTNVKSPSKRKKAKGKSTGAIMKQVGDLFEKGDDTSYDTYDDIIPEDAFGNLDSFYPSGSGSFTSGFEGAGMFGGFKKGGRLKKDKKKAPRKRAALRGQRSELRGS